MTFRIGWTPFQKLSFNVGLKDETQSSFQTPTCRPDTQFFPGACFDEVHAPSFKNFVPRFNLGVRPPRRRQDGLEIRRESLYAADQCQRHRAAQSSCRRLELGRGDHDLDQRPWLPR